MMWSSDCFLIGLAQCGSQLGTVLLDTTRTVTVL
jgi:hypothetical protein